MRQLTADEVEFVLECHPEHVQIRGNCSAIDPVTDAATEIWIREQLRSGNEWSWCTVVVRARWKDFEGYDSLGCCSYKSEESFKQPGGYYDDMRRAALADLNANIERTAEQLDELLDEAIPVKE